MNGTPLYITEWLPDLLTHLMTIKELQNKEYKGLVSKGFFANTIRYYQILNNFFLGVSSFPSVINAIDLTIHCVNIINLPQAEGIPAISRVSDVQVDIV